MIELLKKIFIFIIISGLTSCRSEATLKESIPTAAVSVSPQGYLLERIASGHIKIVVMVPPRVCVETYEPSVKQMSELERASIYFELNSKSFYFENGLLNSIRANLPKLKIVTSAKNYQSIPGDPHIWLSPIIVSEMILNMREGLCSIYKEKCLDFTKNADNLLREVKQTEDKVREILSKSLTKSFLVFHPAWGYFARDFNLQQIPIEENGKEPSAAQIIKIINQAKTEGVKVILVEPGEYEHAASVVAEESSLRIVDVDPLAYNWSENLLSVARAISDE